MMDRSEAAPSLETTAHNINAPHSRGTFNNASSSISATRSQVLVPSPTISSFQRVFAKSAMPVTFTLNNIRH
jgi:hypothetical protein